MGTEVDGRGRSGSSRVLSALLVVGTVFAVVATVLAVFETQVAWLRLAVVLAVWAALFAAVALARSRRDVRAAQTQTDESRLTYQLELQREITARREYESEVLADAGTAAQRQHSEDLAALREQVDRLSTMLSTLLDGDVLVEKLTLSSESTRIRSFAAPDRSRIDSGPVVVSIDSGSTEAPAAADGVVVVDAAPALETAAPVPQPAEAAGAGPGEVPARSAHSSGVSVADLMASIGGAQAAPRRRRRLPD